VEFAQELAEGATIGPYRVERAIGSGSMGTVYQVTRGPHGDGPMALKVLSVWLTSALGRERFEEEVRSLASMVHPNIVAIYDYGETEEGTLYYAMEFLDGLDLSELVACDGPQPVGRALHLLDQGAAALEAAHGAGIVHRDIKPPNLVLCEEQSRPDVLKLVDFGLVLPMRRQHKLTAESAILGTPRYVAPESLRTGAGSLGPAADLYGLGLVGYFLLTGRPAFDGKDPAEILRRQRDEPPPPLPKALPADIREVIDLCLEKAPGDRPPSAKALRAWLHRCERFGSWTVEHGRRWWRDYRERRGA
jgi:serine/threonine protein kinase